MNYQRLHDAIIAHHQQNPPTGYTEKHHLVPKCLGGSNDKSNLVRLTARAHFVVHRLLCKIHPDNGKLRYAFQMMFTSSKLAPRTGDFRWVRSKSKQYSSHRIAFSVAVSMVNSGRTPSIETKRKLSIARCLRAVQPYSGHKNSSEHTAKIIAACVKQWIVYPPTGLPLAITNLQEYCRRNNLSASLMIRVAGGYRSHHKGYRVVKVTTQEMLLPPAF